MKMTKTSQTTVKRRTRKEPLSDPQSALAQAFRRSSIKRLSGHADGLASSILRQWETAQSYAGVWVTHAKLTFKCSAEYGPRDIMSDLVADGWGVRRAAEGQYVQFLEPSAQLIRYLAAMQVKHIADVTKLQTNAAIDLELLEKNKDEYIDFQTVEHKNEVEAMNWTINDLSTKTEAANKALDSIELFERYKVFPTKARLQTHVLLVPSLMELNSRLLAA